MSRRVLFLFMIGLLVMSLPASADNRHSWTAGGNQTVSFYQCNLTSVMHDGFHWNDSENVEPTRISTALHHGCGGEVQVNDLRFDESWVGIRHCHDYNGSACVKSHVHIDLVDGPFDDLDARHLMCHEVGHAVGVAHQNDERGSCMNGPGTIFLTNHDQAMIDGKY